MIEEIISLKDLVTGPAVEMLEGVTKLKKGVEELKHGLQHLDASKIAEGLKGISSGVGMIVTPVLEAGEKIFELGESMVDAALEAVELREQMLSVFTALAGGAEAGESTLKMVDDLTKSLPQSREQIALWTKQFMAMGVTDLGALREQIEATASAQALFGDEGAAAYTNIARKIKDAAESHQKLQLSVRQLGALGGLTGQVVTEAAKNMGLSTEQLAAQMKAGTLDAEKFGDALQESVKKKGEGPLEALMGSLPVMVSKFKDSIAQLFTGVEIKPFTDELQEFFSIFDQSTQSGQAMHAGVVMVMNELFVILGKVVDIAETVALELVILGLKAYIAMKPAVAAFTWLISGSEGANAALAALAGGGIALLAIGITFLVPVVWGLVTAAWALAVGVIAATWPFLLIVAAAALLAVGIYELVQHWDDVVGFFKGMGEAIMTWAASGIEAAENFVSGLIDGITGGISRAIQAVKDMGGAMKDELKSILGIHSPSKVMFDVGGNVADGFAMGVADGSRGVARAADEVASAANDNMIPKGSYAAGGATKAAVSPAASGTIGGASLTVEAGAIVINGAGKDAREIAEEAISLLFERIAASQGAA
jgi:hypothetical protein